MRLWFQLVNKVLMLIASICVLHHSTFITSTKVTAVEEGCKVVKFRGINGEERRCKSRPSQNMSKWIE